MTETDNQDKNKRKRRSKKLLLACLRWGIAVVGVWIVVSKMTLHDAVLLLNPQTNTVAETVLSEHAEEDATEFHVKDPSSGKVITVDGSRLINPPTQKSVTMNVDGKEQKAELLGMPLRGNINENPTVDELLVKSAGAANGEWIAPSAVTPAFVLKAPRPRVTVGIINKVQHANPWLLLLSVFIFPINFIITSYRWHRLLEAIDIHMGLARAFVINMVGSFYNTFLLGSTGGDVIKAYYAAQQTTHRTRAVMSVLIDRVVGLLALVMVAGVMAAYQYATAANRSDPTSQECLHVALVCIGLLSGLGLWLAIMFQPSIRRALGLEFILSRLPMQRQVDKVREVARIYRQKPLLLLWALIITLPVHVTTVVSALLAGTAFGLPIQPLYYFTVVPVVVLVGSIPISPQGAGVMEGFAFLLTQKQGATVNDAVALTMSVRLVQILWNLTGGIFVLRGGYHAPTEREQKEMETDQ